MAAFPLCFPLDHRRAQKELTCFPVVAIVRHMDNVEPKREVRAWMARTGRTQASLASELGLSVGYVSLFLNGHKGVSLDTALRIAELSGLPVSLFAELRRSRQVAHTAA